VRILLTGSSGYLGHHLAAALRARRIDFVTAARSGGDLDLDLDDPDVDRLAAGIARARVDSILHAAATSSLAACEADPDGALRRNGEATGRLAALAPLILVSTDLVFDGDAAPYRAADEPRPRSAYGTSKRLGEQRTLAAGGLVVRVPLLCGPSFDGRRGATDMLRAARAEGRRLELFVDEFRSPLHVADAAAALVELACSGERGIVQLAGPERVSRYEFAERFAAVHGWPAAEQPWRPARAADPRRPRDVTMVSDRAFRPLDAMLADS
jgi:dTDP-4-dehydrorhamnose reductase